MLAISFFQGREKMLAISFFQGREKMLAISFFQGLESEKVHQLKFDVDASSFPLKTAIPKLANKSEVWAETKKNSMDSSLSLNHL